MTNPTAFHITGTLHDACADCLACMDDAIGLARVTGSTGATYSDFGHSCTVSRVPADDRALAPETLAEKGIVMGETTCIANADGHSCTGLATHYVITPGGDDVVVLPMCSDGADSFRNHDESTVVAFDHIRWVFGLDQYEGVR